MQAESRAAFEAYFRESPGRSRASQTEGEALLEAQKLLLGAGSAHCPVDLPLDGPVDHPAGPRGDPRQRSWSGGVFEAPLDDWDEDEVTGVVNNANTPLAAFRLFFTDAIIQHIVTESNRYKAAQRDAGLDKAWIQSPDLTAVELKAYLGLRIYMGVVKIGNLKDYWSTTSMVPVFPRTVMTRDRFMHVEAMLHFVNNDDLVEDEREPFREIRPLMEMIRNRFEAVRPRPAREMSHDELAIKAHHRSNPEAIYRKLHKHTSVGYKIWALAETTGYVWTFEPAVKGDRERNHFALLLELAGRLPVRGYRVFADNLFINVPTIEKMYSNYGHYLAGTARSNAVGYPSFLDATTANMEAGQYAAAYSTDGPVAIVAVSWSDSLVTRMLGSGISSAESQLGRRMSGVRGKVARMAPVIAADYNKFMGGVDTADHLRMSFTVARRKNKAHMPLFGWLLDQAAVNAWIVFQRATAGHSTPSRRIFQHDLVEALTAPYAAMQPPRVSPVKKMRYRGRGGTRATDEEVVAQWGTRRLTPVFHGPVTGSYAGRSRCPVCTLHGRESRPKYQCDVCSTPLCIKVRAGVQNCYREYHTK